MSNWKYTDSTNTVVARINVDGSGESKLVTEIDDWIAEGNTPEPAFTPAELAQQVVVATAVQKDKDDLAAVKTYAKLNALKNMTPVEINTWMTANVTTLVQARDALTTLAIAVSILARRL